MITWVNLLHFYQPPNTEKVLLKQVVKESYQPLISIIKKYSSFKTTINLTGCLTEQLAQNSYYQIIKAIASLVRKKQVELTASAAYHPLCPLIPFFELIKQIKSNEAINQKYFGKFFQPKGFFLPELAYSPPMSRLIKNLGYQWIILDEISYNGKLNQVDDNKKYQIKNSGLGVVFRNRNISQTFVPQTIHHLLQKKEEKTIITATDAELYGHHHKDFQKIFLKILKNKNLTTVTISQFLKQIKKIEKIEPIASSWESTPRELKNGIPYALWKHPKNRIQMKLWELANLSLQLNQKYKNDPNDWWAQEHLHQGLASCTFFWASNKKLTVKGIKIWHPDQIEKGLKELIKSIRSFKSAPYRTKIRAERIYLEIKRLIWTTHWKKYAALRKN